MRALLLTALVVLLAAPGAAQEERLWPRDPEWRGDDPQWQQVDDRVRRAAPTERAALLWLAWSVVSESGAARDSLGRVVTQRADSPLARLWDERPPAQPDGVGDPWLKAQLAPFARLRSGAAAPADLSAEERAEVAALDSARAALDAFRQARVNLRVVPPAPGPAADKEMSDQEALWALCCARPLRPEGFGKVALRRLLGMPLIDEDEHVGRLVQVGLRRDAPGWLGPLILLALGPRGQRALGLLLQPAVQPPFDEAVDAWWSGGDRNAPARLAQLAGALPGELGSSVIAVGAALTSAVETGWRPPAWAEWQAAPDARRLELLERAITCGARLQACPPDAPVGQRASVVEGLTRLGWKAIPRLLGRADDAVLGPGAAARDALEPYLGEQARFSDSRAAWWARWRDRGPASWWRAYDLLPWGGRGDVLERLLRLVGDVGPGFSADVLGGLPRPATRSEAEAWCAALVDRDRREGVAAANDLLDVWAGNSTPSVAWPACLSLALAGDERGSARVGEVGRTLARAGQLDRVVDGLVALLVRGAPADGLGEAAVELGWDHAGLLRALGAHAAQPVARRLLLRMAGLALRAGGQRVATEALALLGGGGLDSAAEVASLLVAEEPRTHEAAGRTSLRRTALLLGDGWAAPCARGALDPRATLARDLVSAEAARTDRAVSDLTDEVTGTVVRPWLEASLRGDVAPLDTRARLGLPIARATSGRALPEPLAAQVRAWPGRPRTARDVVELLAAWRADPTGGAGLEVGLSRAPRGRFAARVRPLAAGGAPATFWLETDGVRQDTIVAAGDATDVAIKDALASAIVDLLLAPDALVDLRLRVWR